MLRSALRSAARLLRLTEPPKTYNEAHAQKAIDLAGGLRGKSVLVVGASTGLDCKLFIDGGAESVAGLDIAEDIGSGFKHPRVTYHRGSVEKSGLNANTYDLVFATATMEHVHNIEAGFAEMVRLARLGGTIFSMASPLWHSPYGHHMGCFNGHPWIHLALSESEIVSYAHDHNITENLGVPIESVVRYMLHPEYFNRRLAVDYKNAVDSLRGLTRVKNRFHQADDSLFDHALAQQARKRFPDHELLAVTHEFSAKKNGR